MIKYLTISLLKFLSKEKRTQFKVWMNKVNNNKIQWPKNGDNCSKALGYT